MAAHLVRAEEEDAALQVVQQSAALREWREEDDAVGEVGEVQRGERLVAVRGGGREEVDRAAGEGGERERRGRRGGGWRGGQVGESEMRVLARVETQAGRRNGQCRHISRRRCRGQWWCGGLGCTGRSSGRRALEAELAFRCSSRASCCCRVLQGLELLWGVVCQGCPASDAARQTHSLASCEFGRRDVARSCRQLLAQGGRFVRDVLFIQSLAVNRLLQRCARMRSGIMRAVECKS